MSDDDIDFELITNASQLAPPPPLAKERVVMPDWRTTSGKAAAFYEWELTALDYTNFQEGMRTWENGVRGGRVTAVDVTHQDFHFLAATTRDANGNRIWHDAKAAIAQLGQFGQASIDKLLAAAQRVNRGNVAPADAEGNSEPTPSGS